MAVFAHVASTNTARRERGLIRAFGLALLIHLLLVAALTWGVGWDQHKPTQAIQAELWSANVRLAADPITPPPAPNKVPAVQAPPTPADNPPPVRQPKINLEKVKKLPENKPIPKAPVAQPVDNKKKPTATKKTSTEITKNEAKLAAIQDQLDKEKTRAQALARMSAQAKTSTTQKMGGADTQTSAPSQGYLGRLVALIRPNITYLGDKSAPIEAAFEIVLAKDGAIQSVTLKHSSGVLAWDEAAYRALVKTERLPLDNGRVISPMLLVMRPGQL